MKNDNLKFGLIYGVIIILITIISYMTNPKDMISPLSWHTILGLVVMAGIMFYAAKTVRTKQGGYITFGEAFVPAFVTYAIGSIMGVFFTYILINHIDPSLEETFRQATLEMSESMYDSMGMSEEMKVRALEEIEKQQADENPYSLAASLLSWLMSLAIMGLPISAIIAAIVKKKEPMPIV